MTYKTAKERAAEIRDALRAAFGFTRNDASVRSTVGSIRVELRNSPRANAVSLKAVEAIASKRESVRRCEVTGDILAGGNTFVSVRRSSEGCEAIAEPLLPAVEAALAKAAAAEGEVIVRLDDSDDLGVAQDACGIYVWGERRRLAWVRSPKAAAEAAAEARLDRFAVLPEWVG